MNKRSKPAPEPANHDWALGLTFQLYAAAPETERSPLARSIEPPPNRASRHDGGEAPESR